MTPVPEPVARVADRMRAFPQKWYLCGGWAVDASLGRQTREHDDIEVAVFRDDQRSLYEHLDGWTREYVRPRPEGPPGEILPWSGDRLELPVHEIHALSPKGFDIEVLLNERSGRDWVFRRDARIILPLRSLSATSPWDVPVLAPQVVLLYKARDPRERDELDFQTLLPHLMQRQCYWLWQAISLVHPSHPWLRPALTLNLISSLYVAPSGSTRCRRRAINSLVRCAAPVRLGGCNCELFPHVLNSARSPSGQRRATKCRQLPRCAPSERPEQHIASARHRVRSFPTVTFD